MNWDLFISHASEDKASLAKPLAQSLEERGWRVWFDECELTIGDSLRRRIDEGLAQSEFGVVILSRSFFSKEWPAKELDGLIAKESRNQKVVLPVWHDVDRSEVAKFSPILASRLAIKSSTGLNEVVNAIESAMQAKTHIPDSDGEKAGTLTQVAVERGLSAIELHIDVDIDEFTETQQSDLLSAISDLLRIEGDLRVVRKRAGSVRLTVEMNAEDAEELQLLIKCGALEHLRIVDSDVVERPINTVSALDNPMHYRERIRERVSDIRARIEAGAYENPEGLNRAVEKLLDELS